MIAIQRAIHKILISVFLSREFKHDETNRAWWTGRWYGRGLGTHVMSQPAREFIVKIIELSLWSSDLLLGHMLLFMLTPPILIPYFDRFHATLLCEFCFWPQIRPWCSQLSLPSNSLVTPIKTNSCPFVFHQTKKTTPLDCEDPLLISHFMVFNKYFIDHQIWNCISCRHWHFRCSSCFT